jgi:hypothetical protein
MLGGSWGMGKKNRQPKLTGLSNSKSVLFVASEKLLFISSHPSPPLQMKYDFA